MNEALKRKLLSTVMDFIHENDYRDLDNFAAKIAEAYEELLTNTNKFTSDEFSKEIRKIRTSFFKTNSLSKIGFSQALFTRLSRVDLSRYLMSTKFEIAKSFIVNNFEIGFDKNKFVDERKEILARTGTIRNPHTRLMEAFGVLLQKMSSSFQIPLHGTKEYSGVDISKKIKEATIGFQIKSVNDDISEDKIRSQSSKAQEYHLDGFVWIYGRPSSKEVDASIQAAFHHFAKINETRQIYCALVSPEILAELFRKHKVKI
jgi:hypothetical protein